MVQEIPVSYIVGVATWPEYRGQGEAKRLLRDALVKMREWVTFSSFDAIPSRVLLSDGFPAL